MVATKQKQVRSYIDLSNTFLAVSVKTTNRNEIQIHDILSKKIMSTFELDSEDKISLVEWSSPQTKTNSMKRTHSRDSLKVNQNLSYLIVALEQGDILVFSPFQNDLVNKISNDTQIISVVPTKETQLIGLDISGQIKIFSLLENNIIKSYNFNSDKPLKLAVQHLGDENMILASNCLHNVSFPSKGAELSLDTKFSVPRGHATTFINSVVQSHIDKDIIITSREKNNIIHIYNKKTVSLILHASDNVKNLQIINIDKEQYLFAFLENGHVEIFKGIEDKKRSKNDEILPFATIKASFELDNVLLNDGEELECVWFDDIKPQYTKFELNESEIIISKPGESLPKLPTPDLEEDDDEDDDEEEEEEEEDDDDEKYVVSTSDELYSLLVSQIDSKSDETLINICKANNSDLNIKQTILKNITLEQSVTLFNRLSIRISEQPSDSINLSKWLKLLLLIHGNNIIKNPDNVAVLKLLRSSLLESTKHLPNLVALQGRLQLLKSQLKLRNEMSSLSIESDEDSEDSEDDDEEEEEGETANGSFYVNGEGDDEELIYEEDEADIDEEDED